MLSRNEKKWIGALFHLCNDTSAGFPLWIYIKFKHYFQNFSKTFDWNESDVLSYKSFQETQRGISELLAGLFPLHQLHMLSLLLIAENQAPYTWEQPDMRDFWKMILWDFMEELGIQNFRITRSIFEEVIGWNRTSDGPCSILESHFLRMRFFFSELTLDKFSSRNFNLCNLKVNGNVPSVVW